MTVQSITCPSESVLNDFGLGKLDAASAEKVSRHLETCADCRRRLANLSGESFVGRLRQANGPERPAAQRQQTYVPGESLANSASNTSGGDLPRASSKAAGLGGPPHTQAPQAVSAPAELADHPDYELIKELGRGGMGTVYLAKNRMMDRLEVLKVISKSLLDRPGALERFQQEIRSAARLAHPNIVAAYSVLRPGDLLVFAMEYVRGQDLAALVSARGYLPVANAAFYIHQVANGLQHAFEKGMVHRDIKPNNLMLSVDGKKHIVKILDFGLAKATSEKGAETGLTKSGQMLGTPDYVAPEQTLDAHKADVRADIYSLGCTLYFLLSGGPPFQEASLFEILQAHHTRDPKPLNLVRPDVPVQLASVVAKMMAKDPAKRYQTPIEVAKALVPFFKPGESMPSLPASEAAQPPPATETSHGLSASTAWVPSAPPSTPFPSPVIPLAATLSPAPGVEPTGSFNVSVDTQRSEPVRRGAWLWSLPPWQRWVLAGGSAAAFLVFAIIFLLQGKDGVIRVEINDPRIEVAIKGTNLVLKQADNGNDIKLAPGEKTLIVERGDFKFETDKLILRKGETSTVAVTLLDGQVEVRQGDNLIERRRIAPSVAKAPGEPAGAGLASDSDEGAADSGDRAQSVADGTDGRASVQQSPPAESQPTPPRFATAPSDANQAREAMVSGGAEPDRQDPVAGGFVSLFNGQDLAGWQPIVDKPGIWRVEGGVLIGTGQQGAVLRSQREDFTDFHLRVEAQINRGGYAGVNFRTSFTPDAAGQKRKTPAGYHAAINSTNVNPNKTGSLAIPGRGWVVARHKPGAGHDRWFVLEVISVGNRIQIKVDGRTTADYVDSPQVFDHGGVALLVTAGPHIVKFRKVEIKELPRAPAAAPPLSRIAAESNKPIPPPASSTNANATSSRELASVKEEPNVPRPRLAPKDAVFGQGRWYWFSADKVMPEEAEQHARKLKGRLMTISSAKEDQFVVTHLKGPTLIGMVKAKGIWMSAAGRPQKYFNWDVRNRQPSSSKREIYAAIHPSGVWHDYLRERLFYCIEWGKEP